MSRKASVVKILNAATATGVQAANPYHELWGNFQSFQAEGSTASGTGASDIVIEVSNDKDAVAWITMGTISLTLGTTVTTDGFGNLIPWKYVRANVSAISGTGASVTVYASALA